VGDAFSSCEPSVRISIPFTAANGLVPLVVVISIFLPFFAIVVLY
jgi:hypothetical protein